VAKLSFPTQRNIVPLLTNTRAILLSLVLGFSAIACNLPGSTSDNQAEAGLAEAQALYDELGVSLEEALAVESEDQRAGILAQLGPPDAFTLRWHQLEGQTVRWEEWSYFDFQSRFDFIDGELLWTLDIEPAPDGSFYAHDYDPLQFQTGLSQDQVLAMLPELDWQEIPLEEADIPEAEFLAADQILLAFDRDQLVFVQTFILAPENELELPPLPTEAGFPTESVTQTGLNDDFDDPTKTAQALLGEEYMQFDLQGGVGRLTANQEGVLPALYPGIELADFSLSTRVSAPNPSADTSFGLLVRSDDMPGGLKHYYYLEFQPVNGSVMWWRYQAGEFTSIGKGDFQALLSSPSDPIDIDLTIRGAEISLWINGKQVLLETDDEPLPEPGLIGLVISSPKPGDIVEFDFLSAEPLQD
jgi:hypothetical protein